MDYNKGTVIYDHQHNVAVHFESKTPTTRTIAVKITHFYNYKLVINVQEVNNYKFNFTGEIDNVLFTAMRNDQHLEIDFDELPQQLLIMLKEVKDQDMFLRLETTQNACEVIFYEKSRLKSLILLSLTLQITNQSAIIDEMAKNLECVKLDNHNLTQQLETTTTNLKRVNNSLKTLNLEKIRLETHCREQLTLVTNKFTASFNAVEGNILDKLSKLGRRHVKLQNDMEVLKNENRLKCESNARLLCSLQALRLENERNIKLIDDYKMEVDHLRLIKGNLDEEMSAVRRQLHQKQAQSEDNVKTIDVLKRDLQEATLIIAQKTKMHDEIAADLVQANSMLVNFNNQYDNLSKDYDLLKETLDNREKTIQNLQREVAGQQQDLKDYKMEYGPEKVQMLQNEIFLARKTQQDLDKQYKEAIKLNALLTRKLSANDGQSLGTRTQSQTQAYINNLPPPSQRSNY